MLWCPRSGPSLEVRVVNGNLTQVCYSKMSKEVSIRLYHTDLASPSHRQTHPDDASTGRQAKPVDPNGTIRADLLGQIAEAQAALESDIELLRHAVAMSGDGATLAAAQGQMSRLAGLQHRIEHAHGGGLTVIRAEVMASVAASQTLAQQVRSTVAIAQAAEVALHAASAAARREVASFAHDFYERKIFDPYLRFASPEEEAAYRQREEAYQRAITAASAEGTPEGNLRATRLAIAQLEDAGAHGADASPDYAPTLAGLRTAERGLAGELARSSPAQRTVEAGEPPASNVNGITASTTIDAELLAQLRGTGMVVAEPDGSASQAIRHARPTETALGRR